MMDVDTDKIAELATTEREAFRAGYLAKMAREGFSPSEVGEMFKKSAGMRKQALTGLELLSAAGVFQGLNALRHAAGTGLGYAVKSPLYMAGAAMGAPVVAGDMLGKTHAMLKGPSKQDVEIMENEGLAQMYEQQTQMLRGAVERANRGRKQKKRRANTESAGADSYDRSYRSIGL
jgi:hypothetical protein